MSTHILKYIEYALHEYSYVEVHRVCIARVLISTSSAYSETIATKG